MTKFTLKLTILLAGIAISPVQIAMAQDTAINEPVKLLTAEKPTQKKRRIIRNVEPIPFWVDADQLRVRDNPVAGDVVGMLELGQKVSAYEQFENWIRISQKQQDAKWVNTDYLTTNQVTWARYDNPNIRNGFSRSRLANDVDLKRIKFKNDKSARIYAASIKETANGNRVIITRQNFRAGPYFEKRLVSCDANGGAERIQILGEGYNYLMMENDDRASSINVNTAAPKLSVSETEFSPAVTAVANYSCQNTL